MRRRPTRSERRFYGFLLASGLFVKKDIVRQRIFIDSRNGKHYIVDFYIPKLRLVYEIDGKSHLSRIVYDSIRTSYLNSMGIKVCRILNEETLNDGIVVSFIKDTVTDREKELANRRVIRERVSLGDVGVHISSGDIKSATDEFIAGGGVIHRCPTVGKASGKRQVIHKRRVIGWKDASLRMVK